VIALLSVGLIVGIVLFLVSRDADTRPRELVASPTPQATVNSNQGDVPGSTQTNRGETEQGETKEDKEDEKGKEETAASNTSNGEKDATPPSPPVTQSPSWRLVGVWRAKLSAGGRPIEVTYTFNADGTSKFVAKDRQGRRATGQGTWQYSEGMLYQTFANGATGKGSIEWLDDDTFEVTIIDNGVPADSGQKRRYHRLR
jgi:hypothetical protein